MLGNKPPSAQESLTEQAIRSALEADLISAYDVEHAQRVAETSYVSPLDTLNQMGLLSDRQLAAILSELTGYQVLGSIDDISPEQSATLSAAFCQNTQCYYDEDTDTLLTVKADDRARRGATFALKRPPGSIKIIPKGLWQSLMNDLDQGSLEERLPSDLILDDISADILDQSRDAPIVRRVSTWLAQAVDQRASDVHFDTRRDKLDVQYRIDGELRPIASEAKTNAAPIIARIKVIAGLDLGERYKSQDGRASIVVRGRRLDIRVSIIPTIEGENAVIRILDRPEGMLSLSALGFDETTSAHLQNMIKQRHGLFIVAGPTGSGKTTTLYACLETLKGTGLKILSVEDPVEFQFEHVNQVQVSEKAGTSFANTLRSFLRHDPDVIMVGEIRDAETARTAVQAALTGHLVMATVHAIDTPRIRTRLIDMGVEPFRLDACLRGALAQRLVRKFCLSCKTPTAVSDSQRMAFEEVGIVCPERVFVSSGCAACNFSGFRGRQVIAEYAAIGEENLTQSLRLAALQIVATGETAFSEVADLEM